jgi:hypothetical protein
MPMKSAPATLLLGLLAGLLAGCASVEVDVWDSQEFAGQGFQTYSWRSEPFSSDFYLRDPIYVIDPILREAVDKELAARGYRRVPRGGDFTIDYIYAPGVRLGAPTEATDNITPRAAIRPNTTISQAERDNAIALSGVKETRNIALQINDGNTNREIWRAVLTKIIADANSPDRNRTRRILGGGVRRAFSQLPHAGDA